MKIAILGAGKLGIRLIEALLDGDYDITVVDNNEDKLSYISDEYDVFTVYGNAETVETLKRIDIKTFDYCISTTTSDDTNILSASFAKILGCKKVIARIREPEHMSQIDFLLEHFNIDRLINPDLLISDEIYNYLVDQYSLKNGIYTSKHVALLEFHVSRMASLVGKDLVAFRQQLPNMLIIGISRKGKMIIPHGSDVIEENDILYLVGEKQEVFEFESNLKHRKTQPHIQKVMIIGGGKTGYYLSRRLAEYGAKVKVIEKDRKRCHYLATKLKNVMILNGDGADIPFLMEEGLEDMDAFVTATGYDEENLLLALTAKNHGIKDVISKVSHVSYKDLVAKLGVDVVLNPLDISATSILRSIRGSKRVLSSVLLQGQAELMEVYAHSNMSMINIPLKKLNLPPWILIAAIHRGTETIIPDGETRIMDGDRVIIVCMISDIGYVEKLFRSNTRFKILK